MEFFTPFLKSDFKPHNALSGKYRLDPHSTPNVTQPIICNWEPVMRSSKAGHV